MCSCIVHFCLDGVHFLKFWSLKAWFAWKTWPKIQFMDRTSLANGLWTDLFRSAKPWRTDRDLDRSRGGLGDWANHCWRIFRRIRSKNYHKQYFESVFWFDWFISDCSWTHKKEIQFITCFYVKSPEIMFYNEFSKRDYISFGVCRLIMYALMSLSYGFMAASQERISLSNKMNIKIFEEFIHII